MLPVLAGIRGLQKTTLSSDFDGSFNFVTFWIFGVVPSPPGPRVLLSHRLDISRIAISNEY
eukprot:m.62490 g.62490  ORF g.62490 m.62490 type:complete len:61 (+) comp23163_c0_seq1:507-689(+)